MIGSVFITSAYAAAPPYSASFTETGLPSGASYNVTLTNSTKTVWSGVTAAGSTATITAKLYNGTYILGASTVMGTGHKYTALVWSQPSSDIISVNGGTISGATALTFYEEFLLNFTETGLPAGTAWEISVGNNTYTSTKSYIDLNEPNGTYSYSIFAVNGYSPTPASGSATVNGANDTVAITYASGGKQYAVTFAETGLPSGTTWYVNLANGQQFSSSTSSIVFDEANGSYSFTTSEGNAHYYAVPSSGIITVNGKALQQNISYYYGYSVNFTAKNLAKFVQWSVTYNNVSKSSTSPYITFFIKNGSYKYSISIAPDWSASPSSGWLNVSGANAAQSINFTELYFTITFKETGLPAGSVFSITINNQLYQSTNGSVVIRAHNGSYVFMPAYVSGYTATPSSGTVSLGFTNVVQNIVYTSSAVHTNTTGSGGFTLPTYSSVLAFIHTTTFIYIVIGIALLVLIIGFIAKDDHKHRKSKSRKYR